MGVFRTKRYYDLVCPSMLLRVQLDRLLLAHGVDRGIQIDLRGIHKGWSRAWASRYRSGAAGA